MGHQTAADLRALRAEVNQLRRQVVDLRRLVVGLSLDVRLAEMRVERRVADRVIGANGVERTAVVDLRDAVDDDHAER